MSLIERLKLLNRDIENHYILERARTGASGSAFDYMGPYKEQEYKLGKLLPEIIQTLEKQEQFIKAYTTLGDVGLDALHTELVYLRVQAAKQNSLLLEAESTIKRRMHDDDTRLEYYDEDFGDFLNNLNKFKETK